jgi:transcriptional regulator with XRE-family HTH domain
MSITISDQEGFSEVYRQVWVRRFGLFIQRRRKKSGYSPEKVARMAGMGTSAWLAAEAGWVPANAVQLRSMAGALKFSDLQLETAFQLCRDAWRA